MSWFDKYTHTHAYSMSGNCDNPLESTIFCIFIAVRLWVHSFSVAQRMQGLIKASQLNKQRTGQWELGSDLNHNDGWFLSSSLITIPFNGGFSQWNLRKCNLYRQLGELLSQNRTKIELKIEPKWTCVTKNLKLQFLIESNNSFNRPGGEFKLWRVCY